jgi:hypothetical protein
MMIKKRKKKRQTKKREKKQSHLFYIGSDLAKMKNKQTIYFVGGAVDRYRADLGLSTFNDGRGIFD